MVLGLSEMSRFGAAGVGGEKCVYCPIMAVGLRPYFAPELQFYQGLEWRWALFVGLKILHFDTGEVDDGDEVAFWRCTGCRDVLIGDGVFEPDGRAGSFRRIVVAVNK